MDEFESLNEKFEKKYDTLELTNVMCIFYRHHVYDVSLLLQRMPHGTNCIKSGLTFTDLKRDMLYQAFSLEEKDSFKVLHEVFEGIKALWNSKEGEKIYHFPVPVQFNAQNSSNRSGYGNRYCGEDLVYEGTLYGETTDYMFIGAKYS